jgi:hypothetical protein
MYKRDFSMKHFLVPVLILLTAIPAFGAGFAKVGAFGYPYDGMFTGGRNTALGQADMAGAFGSEATQINTAPLPLDDGAEVSYSRNPFSSNTDQEVWGGAVDFRGLRLGFSRFVFSMDPQPVRTAYNPGGTGETFDAGDKITVVSAGYDLGRLLDQSGQWNWTVGGAWRGYSSFLADSETSEDTFDLGTSVAWTTDHSQGWTRLIWALSWQNVANTNFQFDERESTLPGSIRMGFTLESAFGQVDWGSEAFQILVAYSRRFIRDDWYFGQDTDHFGLEMTGVGLLAMRIGHNSRLPGNINAWGVGLILDQDFMGRFLVAADYGGYDTINDNLEMWSVRARYSF